MKLRNKITKEIWNIPEWRTPAVQEGDISFFAELNGDGRLFSYKSIAELNADWEDVEPAEPLIKDRNHPERAEKARKTLKMWADANGFKKVSYLVDSWVSVFCNECNPIEYSTTIEFGWIMDGLKPGIYTIAELCGEEEE